MRGRLAVTSEKDLDALFAAAVARGDVPGLVALAADGNGLVYQGAFGGREQVGDQAMSAASVFWLASMTKAVTSVAAMQLVAAGRLALDAPIAALLPELADRPVFAGFDAAGRPRLRPMRRPITLRHLLTHTAGFGYDMWRADIGRLMAQAGVPQTTSRRRAALTMPLLFDPGEGWCYGVNTDFVGKAVEVASGQTLRAYFQDHIFGPLGMTDTDFMLREDMHARRVRLHQRGRAGDLAPSDIDPTPEPGIFLGGGGLFGTGPDYLRFLRMLLGGGSLDGVRILAPETVALMAENQIGDLRAGVMTTAMPALTNDVDLLPGQRGGWGLGFLINPAPLPGRRHAGSLAWAGLANTYYWIDRAANLTGVIMMQILPFADTKALSLFADFERMLYDGARA